MQLQKCELLVKNSTSYSGEIHVWKNWKSGYGKGLCWILGFVEFVIITKNGREVTDDDRGPSFLFSEICREKNIFRASINRWYDLSLALLLILENGALGLGYRLDFCHSFGSSIPPWAEFFQGWAWDHFPNSSW